MWHVGPPRRPCWSRCYIPTVPAPRWGLSPPVTGNWAASPLAHQRWTPPPIAAFSLGSVVFPNPTVMNIRIYNPQTVTIELINGFKILILNTFGLRIRKNTAAAPRCHKNAVGDKNSTGSEVHISLPVTKCILHNQCAVTSRLLSRLARHTSRCRRPGLPRS